MVVSRSLIDNTVFTYPTGSVWGIGGHIQSEQAQQTISKIKQFKQPRPLSVVFEDAAQLIDYIKISEYIPTHKLEELFSFELTLLIPASNVKDNKIPSYIYQNGPFIGIRLFPRDIAKNLEDFLNYPLTTTSLNIEGAPPILSFQKAQQFVQQLTSELVEHISFPQNDKGIKVVGKSSTIIKLEKDNLSVVRAGDSAKEVFNLLGNFLKNSF